MKSPSHPIDQITVHEPTSIHNLTIFPLSLSETKGPSYISLTEAIMDYGLLVKEVDDSGSVPTLLVENGSNFNVLFVDGEELRGAKQNRIVNTTILLAAQSQVKIPVSCVESGRWHYNSAYFHPSKTVMSSKARRRKTRSVSSSLAACNVYESDQGEVWNEVDELNQKIGSHSKTSAMSAAYDKMRKELENAVERIPSREDQYGLIAMIDGKPAGMDLISRKEVYAKLHAQLLQSYAMEAAAGRQNSMASDNKTQTSDLGPSTLDPLTAKAFLERCAAITGEPYPSVALGTDWRFLKNDIVGSGLQVEDTWIHMAYFVDEADGGATGHRQGRMARMSRRSRARREKDDDMTIY